jgi:2-phosphoglycerate kinase
VKKRYEERTKEQPSGPDQRFFDYLKIIIMINGEDIRRMADDPDNDVI